LSGISGPLITQACECYANGAPPPTTSETFDVTTTTSTQSTIIATGTITTSTTTSSTISSTAIVTSTLVIQPASLGLDLAYGLWILVSGPDDYYHDKFMNTPTFTYPASTSFSTVLDDCANACVLADPQCNFGIEVTFYTPDDLWWCIVYNFTVESVDISNTQDPTFGMSSNAGDFLYSQVWV
jgi:hypothetical protein